MSGEQADALLAEASQETILVMQFVTTNVGEASLASWVLFR